MKRNLKKINLFFIIMIIFLISPLNVNAAECKLTYSEAKKMIKESMRSYYIRGPYFQYNTAKYAGINNGYIIPEEGTLQDNRYLVCSGFVHASIKTAFGIHVDDVFGSTKELTAYGKNNQNDKNKVLFYGEQGDKISGTYQNFVNSVQPGDIFVYTKDSSYGHTLMAYDKVDTNSDGKVDDVLLLHSSQKPFIWSRLNGTYRLSYNNFEPEKNYLDMKLPSYKEGTIMQTLLSKNEEFVKSGNIQCTMSECAIIRPYINNNGNATFNFTTVDSNCKKTTLRTEYPNIFIEKSVSKGDKNSVYINDSLTYTIKVTNYNTDNNIVYKNFTIEETLGDYVSYDEENLTNNGIYSNGKVKWEISQLNANQSITMTYTVKVDDNLENINNTITASGKFYKTGSSGVYISTGKVENKIIPKVTKLKDTYQNCYNNANTNLKGLELIENIYSCATGNSFDFSDFRFENLISKSGSGTYKILLKDDDSLNDKHKKFKSMILNNYFSSTVTKEGTTDYYLPKWISTSSPERAKTINSIDFKDGDVLIYNITENEYSFEKGTYAYIYLSEYGKFVGLNGSGYTERNEFYQTYYQYSYWNDRGFENYLNIANDLYQGPWKAEDGGVSSSEKKFIHYQTLFTKDDYVILRPELIIQEVAKIEVSKMPTKTSYIENYEKLSLTDGEIKILYNDGTSNIISMSDPNVSVKGFDNTKVGINTLTVSYEGITTTFDVSIIEKTITGISVYTMPSKTSYIKNYENLNLTGGKIKATYNNNSEEILNMSNENISITGFNNSILGKNTITVSYKGKTTTFDVSIVAKSITGISVHTMPSKKSYIKNYEKLNLTGGKITATYNDNSTETIDMTSSDVSISGFDNSKIGKNTITVSYKGKTTTFDVSIVEKSITKIEIFSNPSKLEYIKGYESLDLSGGKIKVIYNDNSTETIDMSNSNINVTGFDNSKIGKNTLTVSYKTFTTSFNIYIVDKLITKIEKISNPTKTSYIQNYENIELSGGKIKVTYNDNSTETIDMTSSDVTISGFDNSKIGKNTITVSYKGKTTTFEVSIVEKSITKLELITIPTKKTYIQNYESLDLTGGKIKATYNDNSTETLNMTSTGVTVTGFDNSKIGNVIVTVTYKNKTITFNVNVVEKSLEKIELSSKPTKTSYVQNVDELDLTGGKIKIIYNDKTEELLDMESSDITVTGFNNSKLGTITLTLTYKSYILTFDVSIIDKISLKDSLINIGYKIKESFIHGFTLNDSLASIKEKIDLNYTTTGNEIVTTGIEFAYNSEKYTAVIYGDLNGDGKINSADLLKMRQHLLGTNTLSGAYKEAAMFANNTTINSANLLRLRQHLLGQNLITQ